MIRKFWKKGKIRNRAANVLDIQERKNESEKNLNLICFIFIRVG
jgi:hypothetical protein